MSETEKNTGPNRQERRAARTEGELDTAAFLKVADKFIDLANSPLWFGEEHVVVGD